MSVNPDSGTTPPDSSDEVLVIFDTTDLAPGSYSGELCVSSDAPDNPEAVVGLNLTVTASDYIIYMPALLKEDASNAAGMPVLLPLGALFLLPAVVLGRLRRHVN